jgi:hypothetical protein
VLNNWQMGELAAEKHVQYILSVEKVCFVYTFFFFFFFFQLFKYISNCLHDSVIIIYA